MSETISSNGVITLQDAPPGTPVQQLGQFQVQSITPFGNGTDDVKLLNQSTNYVHSVTCIADVVDGISVSFKVGVSAIEVVVEGDLPAEKSKRLAEEVRMKAEAIVGSGGIVVE